MNYPFWDLPGSYGVLMAGMAVLHVFISHFAIGGGLFLVLTERAARRAADALALAFLERLSRFFALVTLVGGALTGVGIWFLIGLLQPAATEALIHTFVWAWAIEWTFFVVEILAALVYYYGWHRLSPADHVKIGWIYFAFAWLSLFAVNGIITFMLTPGAWLETGRLRDGFFNPTFWPSLALRTAIAISLAGLYGLLVAAAYRRNENGARLIRRTAWWAILGTVAAIPAFQWYRLAIPDSMMSAALHWMPIPIAALRMWYLFAAAIIILVLLFGLILPRRQHAFISALALAAGLGWFGSFEWFRESIRKPYIIVGYMYGNGLKVADAESYRKDGYLGSIRYRSGDEGADLFRHACRTCHTLNGYNSLKPAFDGTDRAFIAAIVQATHLLKGNMPPFLGSEKEAGAIADHISRGIDRRPPAVIYGLQGVQLGGKVFDLRCGICHSTGTVGRISNAIVGLTEENYGAMLDNAAVLGVGMPAFTGDETERRALIAYLATLKAEAK